MTRYALPLALSALFLATQPAPVLAGDISFCTSNCELLGVQNSATVVVTKVIIKQVAGPNNCEEVTKTHDQNLTKNEGFPFQGSTSCPYHVKFVTTSGCAGTKDGVLSLDKRAENRFWIRLKRGCGNLTVTVSGAPSSGN